MGNRVAVSWVLLVGLSMLYGSVPLLQADEASAGQASAITEKSSQEASPASKTDSPSPRDASNATNADGAAAREKIWNSPEMIKARNFVDDYFSVSKKYTPEQKAEYKKHLASLTAPQMKMWLMQFDHKRLEAKKREDSFQQVRQAQLAQGKSEIKQYQKSLSDIEKGENVAAANVEKRLRSEQKFSRSLYRQKQQEATRMLEEYSSGGFGWGGFGIGF